jgi:hypothetical protein
VAVNRALPGPAIDRIRDGVASDDLHARGDRAVWDALFRTAASAVQAGWGQVEWEALVLEAGSALGRQASRTVRTVRTAGGDRVPQRTHVVKARTTAETYAFLAKVWDRAVAWVNSREASWTPEQQAQEAAARAAALAALTEDPDTDLRDADRRVLTAFVAQLNRYHRPAVTYARADLLRDTHLGLTALRTALDRLALRGLITVNIPGERRGPNSRRRPRATVYEVATAEQAHLYQYPLRGSVVPPGMVSSAPPSGVFGSPHLVSSAPQPQTPTGDPIMSDTLTLTLSEAERAAVLQTLTAMRTAATGGAQQPADHDNVVPIRQPGGGAR